MKASLIPPVASSLTPLDLKHWQNLLILSPKCILNPFASSCLHCHHCGPSHHHCPLGSAVASPPGSLPSFHFPHRSRMWDWTLHNLGSFTWLCIRSKIKSKPPKRCRLYLPNLQSCHPASSSLCSQQHCQAPLITGSVQACVFPLLSEGVFPCPLMSGRAFSTTFSREAPRVLYCLWSFFSFLQSTYYNV